MKKVPTSASAGRVWWIAGLVLLLLTCMLLLLLQGCGKPPAFTAGATEQTDNTAPAPSQTPAPTEGTAPTEPTAPQILESMAPYYGENPEIAGWIKIDGTVIDYPVMYTPDDPEKYLHRDFQQADHYAGLPFLDARCGMDPESDNLILYGHNMKDGTMFRSLLNYEVKSYWEAHPIIAFSTLYEKREYEIVAAFYDRVYYTYEDCFKFYQFIDAKDKADFDEAVAHIQEKALYRTGVTPEYGDHLITLVTCAYHVENGRFVVVARAR